MQQNYPNIFLKNVQASGQKGRKIKTKLKKVMKKEEIVIMQAKIGVVTENYRGQFSLCHLTGSHQLQEYNSLLVQGHPTAPPPLKQT